MIELAPRMHDAARMKTAMNNPLAASLLSAVFMLAMACGSGGTPGTPGAGGASAGTTGSAGSGGAAGTTGSAGRGGGGASGGSGGMPGTGGAGGVRGCSCDPQTQYCYVVEGGPIGNPPSYSCRALPAACGTTPTCACVQGQGCGNICSAGDGGIMVTCQAP
jgi:hypothetical protein